MVAKLRVRMNALPRRMNSALRSHDHDLSRFAKPILGEPVRVVGYGVTVSPNHTTSIAVSDAKSSTASFRENCIFDAVEHASPDSYPSLSSPADCHVKQMREMGGDRERGNYHI